MAEELEDAERVEEGGKGPEEDFQLPQLGGRMEGLKLSLGI